jgi:AraC-like DNA-binding protein
MREAGTRGILYPQIGSKHFHLSRHAPPEDLAPFVEGHWLVRWDLESEPYETQTLPFPAVNLVIQAGRSAVHGVMTRRFTRLLEGRGGAVGTRFTPGGFSPFVGREMAELTDRTLGLADVFGPGASSLEEAVLACDDEREQCARVQAFLRERLPPRDPEADLATRVVRMAMEDPSVARVEELAARAAMSPRALQRLFRKCVGVTPKWTIQRFRIQEAADRVGRGERVDWPALALELGYFDQAHFSKDFKSQVGRSPAQYAALCEKA